MKRYQTMVNGSITSSTCFIAIGKAPQNTAVVSARKYLNQPAVSYPFLPGGSSQNKSPATKLQGLHLFTGRENLFSFDADKFTVFRAFNFELDFTVSQSKQSMVFAATYIDACMEFSATLTNDDAACQNCFAAKTFYAQTFAFESRPLRVEPPAFYVPFIRSPKS